MQKLEEKGLLPEQMIDALPDFAARIEALAEKLGLTLDDYKADHIALRVNDWDCAERLHKAWLAYGEEWSNTEINGRPIVVIGLREPLQVGPWQVEALELPYPGSKQYPSEGWEHLEFVVPSTAATTDGLKVDLEETFPSLAQYWNELDALNVKIKASSPAGEKERLANPTFAFKHDGVCIKLHPCSLKDVIASEAE